MKKFTSVLLAVLMLFSMFAVSASAAYNKISVNVSKTEANVGDVIKITVSAAADSKLVTFQGAATFNTEYFQLVEGSVATGGIFGFEEASSPAAGKVSYASASGSPVTKSGTLVSFELKVLKTGGTIKFTVEEAYIDDNGTDKDVTGEIGSASFKIEAPKCAHKNVTTDRKEPTCMTDGYEAKICKDCGEQISKKVLNASGAQHNMGSYTVTKEATCKEEGVKTATCSVCGHKDTVKIPKTNHKLGAYTVTKEATCKAEGTKTATCSVCGKTDTQKIAKKAHSYGAFTVTTEATCEKDGLQTAKCTVCGDVKKEAIPTKPHEYETGSTVVQEATCTQPGKEVGKCKNCGVDGAETIIPATGHDFGEWKTTTEATSKKEGKAERTCNNCGEVEEKVLEKLPQKEKDTEAEEKEEKEFPVLPVIIGGGVAAAAILALVIVMILRKKKTNVE